MGKLNVESIIMHFSHLHQLQLTNLAAADCYPPSLSPRASPTPRTRLIPSLSSPSPPTKKASSTATPALAKAAISRTIAPYARGFSCDVCSGVGGDHWLYRCAACCFDAHLHCATANRPASQTPPNAQLPRLQTRPQAQPVVGFPSVYSQPGGSSQVVGQVNVARPVAWQGYDAGVPGVVGVQGYGAMAPGVVRAPQGSGPGAMGAPQGYVARPPGAVAGQGNNGLMETLVQAFVGGMADQMGQSLLGGGVGWW
ncbi:uncharacterized protein LOC18445406 [Amborella trichopoda]|uniref:uncharacterized protein LOC18445406 n=1 Tax=Amborella trichopoda TaxID=13333 RepID=UPI0009C0AA5B|nr:uncharacterized protein LOC18445406 [Amborella trichopoda]|eukprot:XP_020529937.1 uncharacterized protein LOC18445406 [Amborella trichopoda]